MKRMSDKALAAYIEASAATGQESNVTIGRELIAARRVVDAVGRWQDVPFVRKHIPDPEDTKAWYDYQADEDAEDEILDAKQGYDKKYGK